MNPLSIIPQILVHASTKWGGRETAITIPLSALLSTSHRANIKYSSAAVATPRLPLHPSEQKSALKQALMPSLSIRLQLLKKDHGLRKRASVEIDGRCNSHRGMVALTSCPLSRVTTFAPLLRVETLVTATGAGAGMVLGDLKHTHT